MHLPIIEHLAKQLREFDHPLLLLRNPDGWLSRPEVQEQLKAAGIWLQGGSALAHRLHFETRYRSSAHAAEYGITVYLVNRQEDLLEDLRQAGVGLEWGLRELLPGYPINGLLDAPLEFLSELSQEPSFRQISTRELKDRRIRWEKAWKAQQARTPQPEPEVWEQWLVQPPADWSQVIGPVAEQVRRALARGDRQSWRSSLARLNTAFQAHFTPEYFLNLPSRSYLRKPVVVSHVLPHLRDRHQREKLLFLVIDGLAYWQYLMIQAHLKDFGLQARAEAIYAWLPSITRLSRQVLFRGEAPRDNYRQGPEQEQKLWHQFWSQAGIPSQEIRYIRPQEALPPVVRGVSKMAYVDVALDDKMHSSTDYLDLYSLTQNWLERREDLWNWLRSLAQAGYRLFLTTDHGNIEARGWRNLSSKEKLGTRDRGSRSARHLEYPAPKEVDRFLSQNPELSDSVAKYDSYLYFVDDKSFSIEAAHVTHGGSHLLEVLIPFAQITHE